MKRTSIITIVIFISLYSIAANASRGDQAALRDCLKFWPKHPFKKSGHLNYRVLKAGVKVLGIGRDTEDERRTSKPDLVLIKPAVSVLTKNTIRLMNPNGYYCFKAAVTVLGKSKIIAHCKAHIASKNEGVAVAGKNNKVDAVTVFGKATVIRRGCR